jgi:Mrp family chromosome partitioning ATPase
VAPYTPRVVGARGSSGPGQFLYVIRRSRSLILAGILMGVIVGWVSAPGTDATTATFQATHSLILLPGSHENALINKTAALATRGAVPDRVARRLGIDRQELPSKVSAETRDFAGQLLITGRSGDRAQAEALANVTAEELIVELGGERSPLRTLEPAVASPVETGDIRGPSSRPSRALLLGGFGLLLGVGAAVALERLNSQIRSKRTVEEALNVQVVAEVPTVSRPARDQLLAGAQPSSFIEAYRALRTSVHHWTSQSGSLDGHRVIVVTSPIGGEGVTTTVAHLAAALGEVGRSVVVISADLRRPRLHLYFDKAREPGLTDVLRGAPDTRRIVDLNLVTTTRGVRFVPSGAPVRNPAPLLDHIGDHLRDARSLGDIVLVDASPLLTTSDGADVARHADGVLLVVRKGRTSIGAAVRSAELLERLGIPVLGAVLVGSEGLT